MSGILPAGTRLGRYEVHALIGSADTGSRYRAWDGHRNRPVALTLSALALPEDTPQVARFFDEARTAALIAHPNIAAVYAVGADCGRPFVVSELLEGESLRARMRGQRLPAQVAMSYALEIAHGLIAAHELGIVHRSLTPEHVFVTADGCVKILDFGLPAGPRTALGTAAYMSPEQARGAAGDERSDIFSLGVILYEMMAGAPPFRGDTAADTLAAIAAGDPAPLPDDVDRAPELDHLIAHCLEQSAGSRFQSARDVAFVLDFTLRAPQPVRRHAPPRGVLRSMLRRF